MSDWLNELKAGDEVIVRSGYGRNERIVKIARRDKVKIVAIEGSYEGRYSAKTGDAFGGDSWNQVYLVEATPEARTRVALATRTARAISRIRNAKLDKMTVEALEAAADLLDPRPVSGFPASE